MRYYILDANGGEPYGVYRVTDEPLTMERWDVKTKGWVTDWSIARHFVGGEPMLRQVKQREAERATKEMT